MLFLFIIFALSFIILFNLDGRIYAVIIREKVIGTVRAGLVSVAHSSTVNLSDHRLMGLLARLHYRLGLPSFLFDGQVRGAVLVDS